jgi:hypothetical protein
VPTSRQEYLDFLRMWKNADSDVRLLRDAREEYGRLQ